MRRFSLYRRNGIYYCRFWNSDTQKYTSGRSTGERTKQAAMATAAYWERHGIPEREATVADVLDIDTILNHVRHAPLTGKHAAAIVDALKDRELIISATLADDKAAVPFVDFLRTFWTYDESPFVKERRARGYSIGRTHCGNRLTLVNKHWSDPWAGVLLADVTRDRLREFSTELAETKLSGQTLNHILAAGLKALRWAHDNGLIPEDVTAGVEGYAIRHEKRGVLTPEEASAVLDVEWPDERARVANITAMMTGLRAGEVAALRVCDIADDRLNVRHAWSEADGLKSPKNGEERTVPILPDLRKALLALAEKNPNGHGPHAFVFWSLRGADRPIATRYLASGLNDALVKLTLDEDDLKDEEKVMAARAHWKARAVSFHSWRHYFAALIADRVDMRSLQLATGHRSGAVAEEYADHANAEHFRAASEAVQDAFGRVVKWAQTAS